MLTVLVLTVTMKLDLVVPNVTTNVELVQTMPLVVTLVLITKEILTTVVTVPEDIKMLE